MTDHEIQALPLAYQVPENSGACCRQCCGPARSFKMMVRDPTNPHHPLIRMRRPWACNINVAGLCVCCPSTMFVSTGEYHPIGSVAQSERCFDCHKWLDVMGPDDHKVFDLRAGCCACAQRATASCTASSRFVTRHSSVNFFVWKQVSSMRGSIMQLQMSSLSEALAAFEE